MITKQDILERMEWQKIDDYVSKKIASEPKLQELIRKYIESINSSLVGDLTMSFLNCLHSEKVNTSELEKTLKEKEMQHEQIVADIEAMLYCDDKDQNTKIWRVFWDKYIYNRTFFSKNVTERL